MSEQKTVHIVVLYALVAILIITLAVLQYRVVAERAAETWVCSNIACTKIATADELASRFCFMVADENGTQVEACRVVVDGVEQLAPRSSLNITDQCEEYSCSQEVRVRPADYVLNLTASPAGPQ